MWIRLGDKYINMDNVLYTSDLNSSNVILYFSGDREIKITKTDEIQRFYNIMEMNIWKPRSGF